jgi:N-acetylneuraminate synthase
VDFYQVLKGLELPVEWLPELKEHAKNKGLLFICSPFDEAMVDELEQIDIDCYKIASPELNHIPLLEYISQKNRPIICSAGLSKMYEVEEAIDAIKKNNDKLAIMHCVSSYPAPSEDCNLNVIKTMKQEFDVPIGFSDHTLEPETAPLVAIFKGANIIEKHFTLDKNMEGPDHKFALEPQELKAMVTAIRNIEKMSKSEQKKFIYQLYGKDKINKILGKYQKVIAPSEKELYPNDKRSIHAIKDLRKGETLTKENIAILRSERNLNPGLHPRFYNVMIGAKLQKEVRCGQGIKWEDLLQK